MQSLVQDAWAVPWPKAPHLGDLAAGRGQRTVALESNAAWFARPRSRYVARDMAQRLLLADDDPAFREQLATLLVELVPDGEIVASVPDGHAAVAAAMAQAPTVVLIDYAMPGPNGGHAAAVIRQALPRARIVILSGLAQEELDDLPGDVRVVRKGAGMEQALAAALA